MDRGWDPTALPGAYFGVQEVQRAAPEEQSGRRRVTVPGARQDRPMDDLPDGGVQLGRRVPVQQDVSQMAQDEQVPGVGPDGAGGEEFGDQAG